MSDTQNPAPSALPNTSDLEALRKRFAMTDLSNPAIAVLFNYVLERLPKEGEAGETHHIKAKPFATDEIIPLDPINIVQMEVRLPPMPAVLGELQEVTAKPYVSSAEVGEVVAKDPSLTAWLLKLVNSPFFGFSVKVDTVSRAVTLLGLEQFKTLAMGSMLNSLASQLPAGIINLDSFWRHSIATALAAQTIWKVLKREEPERLFVAGLLHDCGLLALAYAAPKTFSGLTQAIERSDKPRYQAEQELLDFDHARLGGMLLHRWNMPLPLVMAVLRHHQVESPERYMEAAVVHLADVIAFAVAGRSEKDIVPPLDPAVWRSLGLKPANVTYVAEAMMARLNEMCEMMSIV
ncbi:HDOD domain-containing protein [Desulfovibrio sp. OttesenSCG-928-F07]|nr:HDOD domain-containing protein [Desulfovibrio sp. OttesenSCG-928-F07]